MRLSHPSAPYQGIPPQDVFFAANDLFVQMGVGFIILSMNPQMYPQKPLEIYLHIEAQPSARDLLLGALLGRAEQIKAGYPGLSGRIYTELASGNWEMLNFYSRNGFANTDAQEEYVMPVPPGMAQTPMGCQLASVPLSSQQEQYNFLQRLNAHRMTPISLDFLTLQMQQPYFMALGFYRGGQPLAEMLLSGGSPESSALISIYTRSEYRRKGIAKALVLSAAALLRERNARQIVTQIYSRCPAQMGLMKSFGATRRRIVTILPAIELN
ncbi:MAG: GNAT family N-acetyltransferase [Clostridiales bacterium]|nr:GNAT family N-acetyltransferase [Clostridiales bacterium]